MGPGATGSAASAAVEAVLSSLLSEAKHGAVYMPELGTFEMRHSPARRGYSIAAGKMVTYPATRTLAFRPSTSLNGEQNSRRNKNKGQKA